MSGPPEIGEELLARWRFETSARLEATGFRCWKLRLRRPRTVPEHHHELAFLMLLVAAQGETVVGTTRTAYQPLTTIFHPPDFCHSNVFAGPARVVTVQIEPLWLAHFEGRAQLGRELLTLGSADALALGARMALEFRELLPCSDLVVEGMVLELLALVARGRLDGDARRPWFLRRCLERLNDDLGARLTLGEVAADLGVRPERLSTAFRLHTGRSFGDYLRELRVRRVATELTRPGASISAAAAAAGFADQAHCTRVFRRLLGVTPGAYRRLSRRR